MLRVMSSTKGTSTTTKRADANKVCISMSQRCAPLAHTISSQSAATDIPEHSLPAPCTHAQTRLACCDDLAKLETTTKRTENPKLNTDQLVLSSVPSLSDHGSASAKRSRMSTALSEMQRAAETALSADKRCLSFCYPALLKPAFRHCYPDKPLRTAGRPRPTAVVRWSRVSRALPIGASQKARAD